jgi:anti-sigma regulatory factor (Ser/Thr protein kinase)
VNAGLTISLPARAENVAVVRHALAGLGAGVGIGEVAIADLETVVTEACMNVVAHAYPADRPGPLEVEATAAADGITVVVRDFGTGIRPRRRSERPSLRLGLTMIAALSSSFEVKNRPGHGTEVTMRLVAEPESGEADSGRPVPATPSATEIRVGRPDLVGPVLGRAVGVVVGRRQVGVDRLSDARLLSDAISAGAPQAFPDGPIVVSIDEHDDRVELRIGPMVSGGAERLREHLRLPGGGDSLATLADALDVERGDEGEFLVLGISAPPAS